MNSLHCVKWTLLLLAVSALCFGQTDYFPLNPNNQWIYQAGGRFGQQMWTVEVAGLRTAGDRTYAVVTGFPQGELLLRPAGDGKMYVWNAEQKAESLYLDFSAPLEAPFPTAVDPCTGKGRVVSRAAGYKGPIGEVPQALEIAYDPAGCADAGITSDVWAPYIGLARRTMTTIAGPVTFELIYARLGGVTVVSDRETFFQLTLDKPLYTANLMPPVDPAQATPLLRARFTLRHTGEKPLLVELPSGQVYDFAIRDNKGETVYQWSAGKAFPQVVEQMAVGPGERNWVLVIPLARDGKVLEAGDYVAEAWLATTPKRYSAAVGFRIEHLF